MIENPYLNILISTTIIYIFVVILLRLLGKNELTQLSISDLVFVLLISNSVQNAMVGPDETLSGGLLAATTLFVINKIFDYFHYRSKKFARLMDGDPVVLIRHGKLNTREMKKNKLTLRELKEAIRGQGIADIHSVDLAILEIDGKINILSDDKKGKEDSSDADEKEII